MLDLVLVVAVAVHGLASLALFVFGLRLITFSLVAWRRRRRQPAPPPNRGGPLPSVTVQIPLYNEPSVARRVIEAACRLDYPADLLQVLVLDDSDDHTSVVVAATVAEASAAGVRIEHVRRPDRAGYKAGALAAATDRSTGDLIALLDADFVPAPDFLRRMVPFFADPEVGFVQARWGHLNPDSSWLVRLQVPAIDGHFLVEQRARGLLDRWFNFNGTAGLWRAEAIADAGGWSSDTLTEDLDLSYRAHLRGWRGRFLPDVVVPGELPSQLWSFRRQQHRWARGSLECAGKLLGPIWRSPASIAVKATASLHLLAYSVHLLLLTVVVSYPAVLLASQRVANDGTVGWTIGGWLLNLGALAPGLFLLTGQAVQSREQRGAPLWRRLPTLAAMIVFGSGLMVNTARAAIEIRTKPNPEFERTAKLGLGGDPEATIPGGRPAKAAASAGFPESPEASAIPGPRRLDRIVLVELALGLYAWTTAGLAVSVQAYGIAAYATVFGSGLLAVAVATLAESRAESRRRVQAATSSGPNRLAPSS